MDLHDRKSCPFCGSDEILINQNYSSRTKMYYVFTRCEVCGAQTRPFASEYSASEHDWELHVVYKALAAWNRRANEHEQSEQ